MCSDVSEFTYTVEMFNLDAYKSFEFINGLAYTNDSILIQNLCIGYLPPNTTTETISEKLEKFGKLLKVRLFRKEYMEFCILHFANAKGAAKALKKSNLFEKSITFPLGSLHQPDGLKITKLLDDHLKADSSKNDFRATNQIKQDALILTLNDDCLEHICKNLSPFDQINFALACQRFYYVMVMLPKTYLNTEDFNNWSLWRIKIFLQIGGQKIKHLVVLSITSQQLQHYLASYCTNVEKLVVDSCDDTSFLHNLIDKMQLITELNLIESNVGDNFIRHLKVLTHLKSLHVDENCKVTGKHIHFLHELEVLSLRNCSEITLKHFKKICKNLKSLHYFDITNSIAMAKEENEWILKYLVQLKTLKFSCVKEQFVHLISQMAKFKQLEITERGLFLTANSFENLEVLQANQLEKIKLNINCIDSVIASSVAKLGKIKVLHCNSRTFKGETLAIFSQLTELEEICLEKVNSFPAHEIVTILENCLKLKHFKASFSKNARLIKPSDLNRALTLLKNQRSRQLRKDCVHINLSFLHLQNEEYSSIGINDFPDVLKVSYTTIIDNDDYHIDENIDDDYNSDYEYFRNSYYDDYNYDSDVSDYDDRYNLFYEY